VLRKEHLRIPKSWEIWAGADTGTFMGGAICAIDPHFELYILEEFPNYRYTGDGQIELVGMTVAEWFKWFGTRVRHYTKKRSNEAWVDANTTFKTEVAHGLTFRMNRKSLELRTEILREYFRNGRVHLMPWLEVIPRELEEAKFPDEETAAGKYQRIKKKDHCLDGVEHVASRRPHPDFDMQDARQKSGIQRLLEQHRQLPSRPYDMHLGAN
jgi:hypothetical protein